MKASRNVRTKNPATVYLIALAAKIKLAATQIVLKSSTFKRITERMLYPHQLRHVFANRWMHEEIGGEYHLMKPMG